MTTTAHRIPLEDLQQRAIQELAANPTISTWTWVDGKEVRPSMSLLEAIGWALDRTLEMVCELIGFDWNAIAEWSNEIEAALRGDVA